MISSDASAASAAIVASGPSDRAASLQNPAAENSSTSINSNAGPTKMRKPAWNVPSSTASPEATCTVMGATAATWPALAPTTSSRPPPPKLSSTASSSSTDSLKSLSDGSAVSAPVVRNYNTSSSSPETVVVPVPQQPGPNPAPNLTRRGSTGSENTYSPQPNNRQPRWVHGANRRGSSNNHHHHHHNNNNTGGGYRGRERGSANWNSSSNNNSPRSPHFYRGNQAMTAPPSPSPTYGFGGPATPLPFFPAVGYEFAYPLYGHVPMIPPQFVGQIAPQALLSTGEIEHRNAILKQIEYYFSTENLCKDTYLRKNMDGQGWVSISLIANFNKVKQLTYDWQLILDILKDSTLVEVQGDKLRRRDNWMRWILQPSQQLEPLADQMQALTVGPGTAVPSHNI